MKISELRGEYLFGHLTKNEYINKMHELHDILFQYSEALANTDIAKIEIAEKSVVMTTRESGISFICDKTDKRTAPVETFNFNSYEKEDFKMVAKLINQNDCVLDVGANIGWYSMNIAKLKPGVMVHSFEPIPKTYENLRKNIELNDFKNIYIHNYGLSNEEKELLFYYYPEGSGNASSVNLSNSENIEKIKCRVRRLDDFVEENGVNVDFIKCDVEGSELYVFQGALETIKKQKPIIFTEMLRKWAKKFNYHPNDIIRLLTEHGYSCFSVKNGSLAELLEINDSTIETNFYFLHEEKHRYILS